MLRNLETKINVYRASFAALMDRCMAQSWLIKCSGPSGCLAQQADVHGAGERQTLWAKVGLETLADGCV